jgi:Ca2+-binding RTX toxin-like protein
MANSGTESNAIAGNFDNAQVTNDGSGNNDKDILIDIERVVGTKNIDNMTGDLNDNIFEGQDGDDILSGADGKDTLTGGRGGDELSGGAGTDILVGGTGDDVFKGGADNDTLRGDGEYRIKITANSSDYSVTVGTHTVTLAQENHDGTSSDIIAKLKDLLQNDLNIRDLGSIDNDSDSIYITTYLESTVVSSGTNSETIANSAELTIDNVINNHEYKFDIGGQEISYTSDADATLKEILEGLKADFDDGSNTTAQGYGTVKTDDETVPTKLIINTNSFEHGITEVDNNLVLKNLSTDTADYSSASGAIDVDMRLANNQVKNDGENAKDDLVGIENIKGSSDADKIQGDTSSKNLANKFEGGAGSDIISGGTGDDIIYGDYESGSTTDDNDGDDLKGGAGNDTIYGQDGDDTLEGEAGNDTLDGGTGNDSFILGHKDGEDIIDGGDDVDSVDYSSLSGTQNLSVTLDTDTDTDVTLSSSGDTDTIKNVENVIGGAGNDSVQGDRLVNVLTGNAGDDILSGGDEGNAGDGEAGDTLYGNAGNDTLSGEAGKDTLFGGADNDVLDGGADNDSLDGGTGIDTISGGDGDDTIYGQEDVDTLQGDAGEDKLYGGTGNDFLVGGDGDDILDGGANNDTADYSYLDKSTGITVDLTNSGSDLTDTNAHVTEDGEGNNDNLVAIERVIGSKYSDDMTSKDDAQVVFEGQKGSDNLKGAKGSDTFTGGLGDDELSGGADGDTLVAGSDSDNLIGGAGNDQLRGDGEYKLLIGDGDTNTNYSILVGGITVTASSDAHDGSKESIAQALFESFNKTANVQSKGSIDSIIDSGNGIAELYITTYDKDDSVSESGTSIMEVVANSAELTINNVENSYEYKFKIGDQEISYTSDADATLKEILEGLKADFDDASNTTAQGYGTVTTDDATTPTKLIINTNSFLHEIIEVDHKNLTLTKSTDTADYSGELSAITVNMNNAQQVSNDATGGTDTLYNIENIKGGAGKDQITGNTSDDIANKFEGGKQSDTILGGAGDDIIYGDYESGSVSNDNDGDTLKGGIGHDTIYGQDGEDTLEGEAGNDTLDGGTGDDVFIMAIDDGEDTVNGGGGDEDTLDYSVAIAGEDVNIDLTSTTDGYSNLTINGGDSDKVKNIENIFTGSGDDYIKGDDNANTLKGNAGIDTIYGEGSDDEIHGGTGVDSLYGGTGADRLFGDEGADTLSGGAGNDTLSGGADNNVIDTADYSDATNGIRIDLKDGDGDTYHVDNDGSTVAAKDKLISIERVLGSSSKDVMHGDDNANIFEGQDGKDTLSGHEDSDTLTGGRDEDSLDGGEGTDTLVGGAGEDKLTGGAGDDILQGDGEYSISVTANTESYKFTIGVGGVEIAYDSTASSNTGGDLLAEILDGLKESFNKNENARALGTIEHDGSDLYITLYDASSVLIITDGTMASPVQISGVDTADYSSSTGNLDIDMNDSVQVTNDGFGGSDTLVSIENIRGGSGDDKIVDHDSNTINNTFEGGTGDDTISGGAGDDVIYGAQNTASKYGGLDTNDNDTLSGGAGADTLYGQEGDDLLKGDAGDDNIFGGKHTSSVSQGIGNADTTKGDTVDYSSLDSSITNDNGLTATNDGTSTSLNIEVGDIVFNDSGDGSYYRAVASQNSLDISSEDFTVTTNWQNIDNEIADSINGVKVDLSQSSGQWIHEDFGTDTIDGVENVIGSKLNDSLVGGDDNNTLEGKIGNDVLVGGAGDDTLDGGANTDTADYSANTTAQNISVDMSQTTQVTSDGLGGEDKLIAIESIRGSQGDDTFKVVKGDMLNHIDGQGESTNKDEIDFTLNNSSNAINVDMTKVSEQIQFSNDDKYTIENIEKIKGTQGDDIFKLDASTTDTFDTIDGHSNGNTGDTVDYSGVDSKYKLELDLSQSNPSAKLKDTTNSDNIDDEDSIINIENVTGTSGNDLITGSDSINTLKGFDGDDTIRGGDETSTDGDWIEGGAGDDKLYGEGGYDTIKGGADADTIKGGAGDDNLQGDLGDDTLFGGDGDDTIDGGDDTNGDWIDYSDLTTKGVRVNLDATNSFSDITNTVSIDAKTATDHENGTEVDTDTLTNIEHVRGSDFKDVLVGDDGDNTLEGGKSDDTLTGGKGDDKFFGGDQGTDTFNSIEGVIGGTGNDTLTGNDFTNTLIGNNGNDILLGKKGGTTSDKADYIDGGSGRDFVSYDFVTAANSYSTGISIDLDDENAQEVSSEAGYVEIKRVENIEGSEFADIIKGEENKNTIVGGKGNDALSGQGGEDLLIGGSSISDNEDNGGSRYVDTADYSTDDTPASNGIIVDMEKISKQVTDDGYHLDASVQADTLYGIENIKGAGHGDDIKGADTFRLHISSEMEQLSNIADGNTFKITIDNSNDLYDVAQIDIVVEDSANKFTDIVSTLNADASFNVNYEASKVDYNGDGTDDVITIKAKSAGVADFSATVQLESGTTATVNSESLDNKFEGLGGDDSLSGRSGDDSLLGGAGDDNLKGGIGNDTLDGGTHTLAATGDGNGAVANNAGDTADYSERTQSINATLSAGDGSVTVDLTGNGFGAGDEVDSLLRIENITGGSNDDVISGDELNNTLKGNSGDDTLSGGLGKDYIDGGFHTSGGVQDTGTPDSGRGDTVSYEYLTVSNQSVEVNLIDELAKEKDGSTTYEDTVRNIENVIASEQDDTITGNSTNNTLDGNKGSDTFYRSAGDDTINGGTSESGDKDIVDYSVHGGDTTNTTTTAAITLTATNAVYSVAKSDGGTDTLTEIEEVRGSDSNDTMTGDTTNATADTFYGGAGKDTLEGGAGDDNLSGEAGDDIFKATGIQDGADTIDGGANGSDTVDYSAITDSDNNSAEGGLKITLNDTLAADFDLDADEDGTFSNDDNNDTITNVENVTGTQNDDEITGDDKDNTLKGEGGDDTLVGGKGNDTLDGGTTNETDGDWVDYDYLTEQSVVTVDGVDTKAKGVAVNIGDTDKFGVTKESAKDINTGSEVGSDSITNIENIKGSKNDDTLIGSSGDNTLDGGAGRDTLSGGDGDDFLQGGDGIDIADYSDATEDLTVNIADGDNKFISTSQGSDSFRNIEGVIGGSGNDTLEGSTGANELKGSGGDDTLLGYGASTGTDILDGGTEGDLGDFVSFDYLDSGKSAVIDLADGNVQDILAGSGVDNVQLIDIENALGGKGNDTIYGSSDRNIISGNDGADALVGRSGADIIIGGSSESDNEINAGDGNKRFVDTIDYGTDSNANFAVTVNMEAVQKQVVNDGYKDDSDGAKTSDTIYGIENIVGSGYDDKFTGASNARAHISGSLEQLKTLSNGEVFTITIGGQSATATVDGTYTDSNKLEKIVDAFNNDTDVNGDYTAYAIDYNGDGKEDVITIVGNDESAFTITFDKNGTSTSINSESLDNKFEGKVGNDTLSGKAGDDILEGGDGDDLIRGGIGNDTIRGGNQTQADNSQGDSSTKEGHGDTLDYSERNQSVVLTNLDAGDGSATVGGTETDTIYGIENIIGSQVADEIEGDDLNNTLKGEAGDDTLSGQNGNDVIEAGAGDDTLSGGLGDDTLNGGTTNDTDGDYVDYTYLDTAGGSTGARINLTAGQSVDIGVGSQVGTDTISNIENVEGSKFADIITGEGDDNTLKGNLGSDTFYRSAGNDEIIGGTGDVDIVDYSVHNGDTTNVTVTDKVIVTASGSTYSVAKNDGGTDTLTQIEQIRGSDKADQMTGDSASDSFFGADNADVLEGKGGNDYLDGEAGNDTFNATRLDGTTSDGDDAYVGGIGTDTVNYNVLQAGDEDSGDTRDVGNGADSSTPASDAYDGVEIDLNSGSQRVHRLFGSDSFNGVENIHGTIFKDYIKGDASDNEFFGNEEDDVLEGKAGADTLHGGSGNDLIIGGADDGDDNGDLLNGGTGSDTFKQNDGETSNDVIDGGEESGEIIGSNIINDIVDYSALTVDAEDIGVELTLNNDTASDVRVTTQLFDHKIKNIENIKGTTGKDSIVGDDDKNTLWGETGADTLRGGAEDDILYGGDGKDVLHGGTGDDQLIGGDGVDTADYSDATNDIAVNITDGQKTIAGFGTDTFSSIEGIV